VRRNLQQLVSAVPSAAVDVLARAALAMLCDTMAGEHAARGIVLVATTADIGDALRTAEQNAIRMESGRCPAEV
jgi:hypothetical protein